MELKNCSSTKLLTRHRGLTVPAHEPGFEGICDRAANRRAERIALLIWGLQGGAFTNLGTTLVRGFVANGVDAELVVVKAATAEQLRQYADISIYSLHSRTSKAVIPLAHYLRQRRPTVLVSMPNLINLAAIAARRLAHTDTKLIVTEHSTLSHDTAVEHRGSLKMRVVPWLMRAGYPFADGLIAPTGAILDDPMFKSSTKHCQYPMQVISNPLSSNVAELVSTAASHPWLLPSHEVPVMVAIGRLAKQKGVDTLLRSMRLLKDQGTHVRLLILGDGPLQTDLGMLSHRLRLEGCVEFLGFQRDAMNYLNSADMFVLASRWEGFGLVLLEAMALGKPIVATGAPGGPTEILRDGDNALVVPVDDPYAFSEAVEKILTRPALAKTLASKARSDVGKYTAQAIARSYLQFFDRVELA